MEAATDLIRRGLEAEVELAALQRPSQKRCFKQMSSIPL